MLGLGKDVITVGKSKIGQQYVLGADVPLDNSNWKGPWDCAEYASWCVFQAYGIIFGAGKPAKIAKAEPYSGHWYTEAKKTGNLISAKDALDIPGAFLLRRPGDFGLKVGHVAIAIGDGNTTQEARGKASGVGKFTHASTRPWTVGFLLPGVNYEASPVVLTKKVSLKLPPEFRYLKLPNFKGADIVALQKALLKAGINPGPIDGEFGPMTHSALVSFQVREGLEVDGVVGKVTANKLGLAFPMID